MELTKSTVPAAWTDSGRVPCLDGLRAVAIALVVWSHASPKQGRGIGAVLVRLAHEARIGVDVFFVISGFLITLLLLREADRDGSISLGRFYARRALRLLPAMVVYLGFIACLSAAGVEPTSASDWIAATTYTMNLTVLWGHHAAWPLGHLWSLSVEEHFYLIWPLALACLGARRGRAALMVAIAAAPTVRVLLWEAFPADASFALLRVSTPARLDAIGAGCLLAFLFRDPGILSRPPRGRAEVIARASAIVLVASCLVYSAVGFFEVAARDTLKSAAIAAIVARVLTRPSSRFGRLLEWRPVAGLGALSYSLYLWQQPFLDSGGRLAVCRFPANLALAFACALASHALVERPFLRLKDRLGRRSPGGIPRPHVDVATPAEVRS